MSHWDCDYAITGGGGGGGGDAALLFEKAAPTTDHEWQRTYTFGSPSGKTLLRLLRPRPAAEQCRPLCRTDGGLQRLSFDYDPAVMINNFSAEESKKCMKN